MSIDVLERSFPKTDKPGLDTLDPRWGEISDLAQAGKFAEAAAGAADLLGQDVCDVRLLGYVGLGHFLQAGPGALADLFSALAGVMNQSWDAFGPADGRDRAAQTSLGWLLDQLTRRLKREEDTKGPGWKQWTAEVGADSVDAALAAAVEFGGATEKVMPDNASGLLKKLTLVQGWLKSFRNVVYRPPEPEPVPAPEEVDAGPTTEDAPAAPSFGGAAVQGSYHLHLLMRKLDAFARLVEERKFPQAFVVADDLQQTISAFDPLLYFPALFVNFMKLMAQNSGDIAQQEGMRDSPEWKALLGLYRVDLDGFVKM